MSSQGPEGGNSERVDRLIERVMSSVKRLRESQLTMLQAEIIDRLMESRKTTTELVSEIYAVEPGDDQFQKRYARMRRSLKDLEIKGYATTNLLGREKHYRLTRNGVAMLLDALPEMGRSRLVGGWDWGIFIATICSAILLLSLRQSTEPMLFVLFAAFFSLLGMSLSALGRILRKVI